MDIVVLGNNRRPIPPYKPLPTESSFHKERPENKPEKPLDHQVQGTVSEHNAGNKVNHGENQSENPKVPDLSYQKNESSITTPYSKNENKTTELTYNEGNTTKKYQQSQKTDKVPVALSPGNFQSNLGPSQSLNVNHSEVLSPKPTDNSKNNGVVPSVTPETTANTVFETTLNIETSSSVQLIENVHTTTEAESSVVPLEGSDVKYSTASTPVLDLQPSKTVEEDMEIKSSVSTPTDGLTSFVRTTESLLQTHNHPLLSTSTPFMHSNTPGNFATIVTVFIYFLISEFIVAKIIIIMLFSVATDRYRPRPGIVLDDTLDYTGTQGVITRRPGPPRHPQSHETFDVVVSAIQGPGGGSGMTKLFLFFEKYLNYKIF